MRLRTVGGTLVLGLGCAAGWGQGSGGSADQAAALFRTVQALDARLFAAYNGCDLPTLGAMVAEDLEFYHDQTGLARGRAALVEGVRRNICGKVRRELVPGSLEVYPLKGYGAVEVGVHRFTHPGIDAEVGEAKFTMLWENRAGRWWLTRVISYDHGAAAGH